MVPGLAPTDLEGRLRAERARGGGIQPGSHPQYETPPAISNPLVEIPKIIGRVFNRKPKTR